MLGESPGASEDVLGAPFRGPAGQLLDAILNKVLDVEDWAIKGNPVRIGMTNLIACIPKEIIYDEENPDEFSVGNKIAEPAKMHVDACSERLQEIYSLAKPKKIVCVGKLAEKYVPKILDVSIENTIGITHPAAILRADISARGLAYQRVVVQLEDLFDELREEHGN